MTTWVKDLSEILVEGAQLPAPEWRLKVIQSGECQSYLCWNEVTAAVALLLGVVGALIFGNPYLSRTRKFTSSLLGFSVMGLGAGMNLGVVGQVGLQGIGYTVIGISSAVISGTLLGNCRRPKGIRPCW